MRRLRIYSSKHLVYSRKLRHYLQRLLVHSRRFCDKLQKLRAYSRKLHVYSQTFHVYSRSFCVILETSAFIRNSYTFILRSKKIIRECFAFIRNRYVKHISQKYYGFESTSFSFTLISCFKQTWVILRHEFKTGKFLFSLDCVSFTTNLKEFAFKNAAYALFIVGGFFHQST